MYSDFAIIADGEVKNIIFGKYVECNLIAKQMYGENAFAVEVWSHYFPASAQIPCTVGDTYSSGKFYRDGIEITAQENIEGIVDGHESRLITQSDVLDRTEAQSYYTAVMTDTLIEEEE